MLSGLHCRKHHQVPETADLTDFRGPISSCFFGDASMDLSCPRGLSIYLSVCPYNYLSCLSTSNCLSLSVCLSVSVSLCLSVCQTVCLSVSPCLSPPPSLSLSLYIYIYISLLMCLSDSYLSISIYPISISINLAVGHSVNQSIFLLHKKMRYLQHGTAAWTLVACNRSVICCC